MKPKSMSNVQFVKSMMEYSEYGPLAQLFILDALAKWSEKIASIPPAELAKAFGEDSFVSPAAWQGVAKEIKAKIEARSAA